MALLVKKRNSQLFLVEIVPHHTHTHTLSLSLLVGFPYCVQTHVCMYVQTCLYHLDSVYATIRKGATEGQMKLKLQGYKLKNLDGFLQKSDPYYEIHKRIENSEGFIDWYVRR